MLGFTRLVHMFWSFLYCLHHVSPSHPLSGVKWQLPIITSDDTARMTNIKRLVEFVKKMDKVMMSLSHVHYVPPTLSGFVGSHSTVIHF